MSDTQGFQLVLEATKDFLQSILRSAWKSGGSKSGSPQPAGSFGQFFSDGIKVPPIDLGNGLKIADLAIAIQEPSIEQMIPFDKVTIAGPATATAELQGTSVPSLQLLPLSGKIQVTVSVGNTSSDVTKPNVAFDFQSLAPDDVKVSLSSDPVLDNLSTIVQDYVDQQYFNGFIPHSVPPDPSGSVPGTLLYQGQLGYNVQESFVLLDGPAPAPRIAVVLGPPTPLPQLLHLTLPLQLSISVVDPIKSSTGVLPPLLLPMDCSGSIVIAAPLTQTQAGYVVNLERRPGGATWSPNVSPPSDPASDYAKNQKSLGAADLEQTLRLAIQSVIEKLLAIVPGSLLLPLPTKDRLEKDLAEQIRAALIEQKQSVLWAPQTVGSVPLEISELAVRIIPERLVLAVNPEPGANAGAIVSFIPPPGALALAMDANGVQSAFSKVLNSQFGSLPHTIHTGDHDVVLNSVFLSLQTGSLRVSGDVTVKHAFLCFDVSADFSVDITLAWGESFLLGSKDIASGSLYGSAGALAGNGAGLTLSLNVAGAGETTLTFDGTGATNSANQASMLAAISATWPLVKASQDPMGTGLLLEAPLGVTIVVGAGTANAALGLKAGQGAGSKLVPTVGNPNVDVHGSALGWLLGFIIGLLTGGLAGGVIGAIIGGVVTLIVQEIARKIGAAAVSDAGFGGSLAWPANLSDIVFVEALFQNPIFITPDGIVFWGA